MSTAYNEMIALLEQFIDQSDMAPVIAAVNAYCRAAVLAERERAAQECDKEAARWQKSAGNAVTGTPAFIQFSCYAMEAVALARIIRSDEPIQHQQQCEREDKEG